MSPYPAVPTTGTITVYPPTTRGTNSKIFAHSGMTERELANCIRQVYKLGDEEIAGLYAETRSEDEGGRGGVREGEVLVPLSHIISNIPTYTKIPLHTVPSRHIKYLKQRDRARENRKMILQDPKLGIGLAGIFAIAHHYGYIRLLTEWLIMLPYTLTDLLIETPLKQLYRNGPSIVGGWEGEKMEKICMRITYHGDVDFWARNMEECLKIYHSKELSLLLVTKPILYLVLLILAFTVIHALVKASAVSKPDPDMVATYKAFKVLGKNFRAAGSGGGGRR